MKREANLFERSLIYMIPFTVVFSFVVYLITKNDAGQVKSLVLGSVTAIVLNFYHTSTTERISKENPLKLKKFTITSYFIRYLIYTSLIVVGTLFSDFDPVFMIFGFLEYPVIMMINSFASVR